ELLRTLDVAKCAIVEHDRDDVQPVLTLCGELGDVVQVSAVARDGKDGSVRVANLGTERRSKSRSEGALIARPNKGARRIDGETDGAEEGDLGQVVDGDGVI